MDNNLRRFAKEHRNGHSEVADDGRIYMPKSKIFIGGHFIHDHIRNGESLGEVADKNTVVNEGLNSILSVYFNGGTQLPTWYVGIFEGNYTPLATDTAANIATNATESTAYTEANRPEWIEAAPSAQQITNSASKATFTMNATKTVYGAFLVSTNTKSGTAGTLFAASKFAASRAVVNLDQLLLTYTLSAADA